MRSARNSLEARPMRGVLPTLTAVLLGSLTAQEVLLVERVPAPLAYVAVTPGAEPGAPDLGSLLDDVTVRHLLAPVGDPEGEASLVTLERLRGLLALSTGELELVLTGLLPRADAPALPLLLGRVRLSAVGRDRLEEALSDPAIAVAGREIAGYTTYELASVAKRRPGSRFELVLVGRDLLVTNHVSSIEEVLSAASTEVPSGSTGTGDAGLRHHPHPRSLAADPGFRAMQERLQGGPGTALVHLDWRRLRLRALAGLGEGRELLLQSAGLLAADRIALGLRTVDGDLLTTVVIDQPGGADGLLAIARPAPVRKLVQELPGHGVAALAFSIEPARLRQLAASRRGLRGLGFHAHLVGGCQRVGLDFDAQVVPCLGDSGTCRLVLLEDDVDPSALALSFRVRSTRRARSLLDHLGDALERAQIPVERRGRGDREVLVVTDGRVGASLGVVGESLVLGAHPDVVERIADLDRKTSRRVRSRAHAATQSLLDRLVDHQDLDSRAVVGVLEVDGSAFTRPQGARPGRHAGVILLDQESIRIEMISRF